MLYFTDIFVTDQPIVVAQIEQKYYIRVCSELAEQLLAGQLTDAEWLPARELEPSEQAMGQPVINEDDEGTIVDTMLD